MSNLYTHFCGMLSDLTVEEKAWLVTAIHRPTGDEPWIDEDEKTAPFKFSLSKTDAFLYSEEQGSAVHVAELVRAFLEKFRPNASWGVSWANTSSSTFDSSGYGGGAVFVTAKEIRVLDAIDWLRQQSDPKIELPASVRADIQAVVDYDWEEEQRDYYAQGKDSDHVFLVLRRLNTITGEEPTTLKEYDKLVQEDGGSNE